MAERPIHGTPEPGHPEQRNPAQEPASLHLRCNASLPTLHLDIDLSLSHAWTVLFGPSGSGKSTLLRLIAGLWRPSRTSIVLHGRDLTRTPAHLRRIGFVSQSPALFPHLSVRGNVSFGQAPSGVRPQQIDDVLHRFGIAHLASARVETLSGGEAQRVAIARALFPGPSLLLLDESFSGLHRDLRSEFIAILRAMQAERPHDTPMPILSVTHDVGEAFACADHVLRLESGKLLAGGAPARVLAPERNDLLRQFQSHPEDPSSPDALRD